MCAPLPILLKARNHCKCNGLCYILNVSLYNRYMVCVDDIPDISDPQINIDFESLNSLTPGRFDRKFVSKFQIDFDDWWLRYLLRNCPRAIFTRLRSWSVNSGSGNGLVSSGHYLSQCWPSSMSLYGVTRPNVCQGLLCLQHGLRGSSSKWLTHDWLKSALVFALFVVLPYELCAGCKISLVRAIMNLYCCKLCVLLCSLSLLIC